MSTDYNFGRSEFALGQVEAGRGYPHARPSLEEGRCLPAVVLRPEHEGFVKKYVWQDGVQVVVWSPPEDETPDLGRVVPPGWTPQQPQGKTND